MLKKNFPFLTVVGGQLLMVGCFFVNVLNNDVSVNKYGSVIHNENLDKIATSVSVLFKKEVQPVVMVDDTLVQELPSISVSASDEKKKDEKVEKLDVNDETTPLYAIDASKYKNNKSMGFVVTEDNKHYTLEDDEFNVVVAVVAGEYDRNLNDALGVVSVILNRCDSDSWASWAGASPYDQVVMKGQFEVYFEGYYRDYMPGGTKYGTEKYEVAKQAVIDGLNGIRNNKYLGFRAWWVSEYSNKYVVTGGNRYGYN